VALQSWSDFKVRALPSVNWQEVGLILTLDPGETTGWSRWLHGELYDCGQYPTGQNPAAMVELIRDLHLASPPEDEWDKGFAPTAMLSLERIVYEEYRIRGNRAQEHVGSEVVTIQHIGAIKVVADMLNLPLTKQTAGMAKGFATDAKLRRWELYQSGQKHANDAIRHGVYFHLFGLPKQPAHRTP
jgi:hypothetical protein